MNQSVEFFTTGDPYLIEAVLNAVMMALDAGGLGAGNAIGGAMAIGILVSAINALITGEFSFNKLIAAFVVWFMMFGFSMGSTAGTRYDAVITGPNGSTAFVTDLPLGIAMPFYVLGIVGPEMNDVLTTAFALPRYVPAGDGTADSVRIPSDPYVALMNLRQWTPTQRVAIGADEDLPQSMVNYVSDCYNANLVRKGIKDEIDSKSYHNYWPSIDTGPVPFTTEVYFELSSPGNALNSGEAPHSKNRPAEVHCDIAHQEILNKMDTDWVNSAIGDMEISGRVNVNSAVALTNATVAGSVTAANLVRSEFARYVVRRAAAEGTADFSNLELSMEKARFRAMQDKNTKGAAEFSYYNENWTIMLQIFEIICYFVTVLIPFLILISGGALLKILLAWLTLVVWVNTIPITAVLSRLFVEYYASLAETCANPTSPQCLNLQTVGGIEASYTTIETALGMGGTIAQLMPTVTLFLLTGSAYALMGAANAAPKASTDTSNINPKFGGVVNSDGSAVNSRGLTATLGAETGASYQVANQNGASPSVKISNNFQSAAQSAANTAASAGREFGNMSQTAMQNLRSTSKDESKTSELGEGKTRTLNEAVRFSDTQTGTLSKSIGETASDSQKTADRIMSSMGAYVAAKASQDAGIFETVFGTNFSVEGGARMSVGKDYSSEDVSQYMQSIGVERSTADALSKDESFVNQLAKTATEVDKNAETLKEAYSITNTDTEGLSEAYKRSEQYSEIASFAQSASMGVESNLSFGMTDFIKSDTQEEELMKRIAETGNLTQSAQLEDFLTQGMSQSQRDQVLSDFNSFAANNDYSNKSYDERQNLLDDFVSQQKADGVDFSKGEAKRDAEIKNINDNFNQSRERQYQETGVMNDRAALQQFMLNQVEDLNRFGITGNAIEDANGIRRYDDNVDLLSEFIVSPEKEQYLKERSQGFVDQANSAFEVNSDGAKTVSDANSKARLETDDEGRVQFAGGNRSEAFDQEFDSGQKEVRASAERANGMDISTIDELDDKTKIDEEKWNKKLEESRAYTDRSEEIYSEPESVAPYQVNMEDSYDKQVSDYLSGLPISTNLSNDAASLFEEMKSNDLSSKLQNGFELLNSGKTPSDSKLEGTDVRDMKLAQAYTAVQNDPSLREFNDVAQQLTQLQSDTTELRPLQKQSIEANNRLFEDEVLPQSANSYDDLKESGRYKTDFAVTESFMSRFANDMGYKGDFTSTESGIARGTGYEAPVYAIDAAQELSEGNLKGAFDTLRGSNVNGRDTQLMTMAGTEMIKYGDDTQRDMGRKMVDASNAFSDSGGDFGKFAQLYYKSQAEDYGKGANNNQPELEAEKTKAPYDFNTSNSVSSNPSPLMPIDSAESQGTNGKELSASQSGSETQDGNSTSANTAGIAQDRQSGTSTPPNTSGNTGANDANGKEFSVTQYGSETQGGNSTSGNTAGIAQDRQSGTSTPPNTSGNAGANDANGKEFSASQSGSQGKGDDSNDDGEIAQNNLSGDEKPVTVNESSERQGTGEKELSARASEAEQPSQGRETGAEPQYNEEQQNDYLANTFGSNKAGSNDEGKA